MEAMNKTKPENLIIKPQGKIIPKNMASAPGFTFRDKSGTECEPVNLIAEMDAWIKFRDEEDKKLYE